MDVSIIIINYKSAKLVINCVQSIQKETHQYSNEIIVVDNDSQDDCKVKLSAVYPAANWLQTGYNAGFARANNAGIRIANGEYILILNADTIILDGAIDKSISLLKQEKDAVGCGVQLLNTDGSTQISGAHFVKGGTNTLLSLPYFGKLIRYLSYRFKSTVPIVQTLDDKVAIDWVVGPYILVKKDTLEQSGLMDGDFFMYADKIEWCGRLQKLSKLFLFAEQKVIHIGGSTSSDYYTSTGNENGKNLWNKKGRQIIISNMLRIRKQTGIGGFLVITGAYFAEIPIFFFFLLFHKIIAGKKAWNSWGNVKDYTANIGLLLSYFSRCFLTNPIFIK